jgi:hypothetical protein
MATESYTDYHIKSFMNDPKSLEGSFSLAYTYLKTAIRKAQRNNDNAEASEILALYRNLKDTQANLKRNPKTLTKDTAGELLKIFSNIERTYFNPTEPTHPADIQVYHPVRGYIEKHEIPASYQIAPAPADPGGAPPPPAPTGPPRRPGGSPASEYAGPPPPAEFDFASPAAPAPPPPAPAPEFAPVVPSPGERGRSPPPAAERSPMSPPRAAYIPRQIPDVAPPPRLASPPGVIQRPGRPPVRENPFGKRK